MLERLGHRVDVPLSQTCCGQMHLNTGYTREARPMVRRFAEVFAGLDAGPGQGRRMVSLVPDYHLVVVTPDTVVGSVPAAVARLVPTRPQTWISGPSATSDIKLDQV